MYGKAKVWVNQVYHFLQLPSENCAYSIHILTCVTFCKNFQTYFHTRLCNVQDDHYAWQEGMGTQRKETIKRREENEEQINRFIYL